MPERRDRLSAMMGPDTRVAELTDATVEVGALRQQVLLYVPPPGHPGPWVSLLQDRSTDVLVATTAETADTLLSTSRPSLVVAVVPVLGEGLRAIFARAAPQAEVRVVGNLQQWIRGAVVPPAETIEFMLRSLAAVIGVAAQARDLPPGRAPRTAAWADSACRALGLSSLDRLSARLAATLYDVPSLVRTDAADSLTTAGHIAPHWSALAAFVAGFEGPIPVGLPTGERDAPGRPATPSDVVEAAHQCALMIEVSPGAPIHDLRLRAGAGGLHPAAVEAVLAAVESGHRKSRGLILLVEPDASSRNLLALRLGNEGYEVATAADGRSALEAIASRAPNLVLSEAVLPGLDGFALLDAARRRGLDQVPFVFLSTRNDTMSVNKGLLLGAADFLTKPVSHEILLTKLQKLMGQTITPAEASARISLADVERGSEPERASVSSADLAPGMTVLGRFQILDSLGEGGMGKIFKARDERLDEDVVLKVIKESLVGDPRAFEHFKREIRLARKIAHPSVVRLYELFEAGPLRFVTMEYLDGVDLRHELRRRRTFPVKVALSLATELFDGLAAAHDLGVIHRDIKPPNLFLTKGGRLKILDFGIAQGLDPSTGQAGTVTAATAGTPEYMSPEQVLSARLDPRTDVYSAGLVLFEMLTGTLPFHAADRVKGAMLRLQQPPPRPSEVTAGIDPALDEFVLRLLSRDRAERPSNGREALEAIRAVTRDLDGRRALAS